MQISLITCDSGDPLYSKFGHTALRIVYSNTKSDEVYDYGIFNFDDPWFLWKFLKGSLEYKVDQRSFQKFLNEYKLAERSVKAQTLLLSDSEKQAILLILQENLKPENRYYRYDFIEDNCTTRIRDLILREGTPTIDFDEVNASARSYLKGCLEDHKWIGFGIDLLLGSPTDQPLTDHGLLFLPHTLHDKIAENRNGNSSQPWAEQEVILHQAVQSQKSRYITPLQTSLILSFLLAILALTSSRFLDIFHPIMMGLLAVASAFLLIMWLGTSHSLTKDNWNIVWANPGFLIYFLLPSKKLKLSLLGGMSIMNLLLLVLWNLVPQDLNEALIPMIVLISFLHMVIIRKALIENIKA